MINSKEFLNEAFTSDEQACIVITTVKTGNNAELKMFYSSYDFLDGGADTQDKVFLLSVEEAMEYSGDINREHFFYNGSSALLRLQGKSQRYINRNRFFYNGLEKLKAAPTVYAYEQGLVTDNDLGTEIFDIGPHDVFVEQGVLKDDDLGHCCWWLRSPGRSSYFALCVDNDGFLFNNYVIRTSVGVRPAIWVDVNSVNQ